MPVELAPRAEYLLVRTRELEARALADKDRIASSLLALAGRHQAPESGRNRTAGRPRRIGHFGLPGSFIGRASWNRLAADQIQSAGG